MPIFGPEDLSEAGAGASNLLQGLASTIANNVCELYQSAPRGFVGLNPVSDAVNSFNSGFWDDFCGRLPEPKVPPAPAGPGFSGGQCQCQGYSVAFQFIEQTTGTPIGGTSIVLGPITGTFTNKLVPGSNPARYENGVVGGDCSNGQYVGQKDYVLVSSSDKYNVGFINVSTTGGQSDSCGNPPVAYPDVSPPPQNPGTYPYTGNDGIERPINFSIDFDPTVNGPLVRLPDIPNLCVGFGYGGIEIDLCTNKPGEGSGGDISAIEDKIDALRDILDRLEEDSKENLNKEDTDENPPDQTDPENEPPDGGISKCVPNLRFVKVTLTNIPPNANVEVGQAGFDRIDDAGWFTFTKDGFFFPPQRIEFGGAIFEAPPGVECFTMQLRFGFTAVVTTVVKDN